MRIRVVMKRIDLKRMMEMEMETMMMEMILKIVMK
jgi:hypothetical protein